MRKNLAPGLISLLKPPYSANEIYLNQIPCLFPDNDYYILYWQTKKQELINSFQFRIDSLNIQLSTETLSLTKDRLNKLIKAYEYNLKKTDEILCSLDQIHNSQLTLKDIVPSQQTLSLYWNNIFRDWSWETEENKISLDIIKKIIPTGWKPENFVVLGSGSCRLAVDIHQEFQLKNTLALDFNPFLLFIAKQMIENQQLKFFEIPATPINIEESTMAHFLKSPYGKKIDNFYPLLGDIQNLPFKSKSIHAVLTPWVIDILPMSVAKTAERINDILITGGEWINFGPLGFMNSKESNCPTFEEIKEILKEKGFSIKEEVTETIPYLDSPKANQKRFEKIICFKAIKEQDTTITDFYYLPEWLINKNLPIPLTNEIKQHQILAKTNADIFFTIDGVKSFSDIMTLLELHYKMPKSLAQQTLMSLFTKFIESQNRTLK